MKPFITFIDLHGCTHVLNRDEIKTANEYIKVDGTKHIRIETHSGSYYHTADKSIFDQLTNSKVPA